MPKRKNKKQSVFETFVSPLVRSMMEELSLDLSDNFDPEEIQAVKEVESSNDSKVLVYCFWEGAGKNWNLTSMDNTDKEYTDLVNQMLGASGPKEQFEVRIFKSDGSIYNLRGETVLVRYHLEPA